MPDLVSLSADRAAEALVDLINSKPRSPSTAEITALLVGLSQPEARRRPAGAVDWPTLAGSSRRRSDGVCCGDPLQAGRVRSAVEHGFFFASAAI
jgi:hypothetical protein